MSDISDGWIKSVIDQVEAPWQALDTREKDWHNQLLGKLDETKFIPERYTQSWSMPSREADRIARQVRGLQDLTLEVGVENQGHYKRDDTRADDAEVFFAHCYLRLNPNGLLRQATHFHQGVSRFAAWWLEMEPLVLPKQGKGSPQKWGEAKEKARKEWWPWTMQVLKPSTVAAEEKDLKISLATRRFKLRAIDLAEKYGEKEAGDDPDDPEMMLKIFGRTFPYLRGGGEISDRSASEDYWQGKEFEVLLIDTGAWIYHCIKDPTGAREAYKTAAKYPNPFGSPSLILAPGNYKHGFDVVDRFEPWLISMLQNLQNEAEVRSFVLTMALQPRLRYIELPESVALARANAQVTGVAPQGLDLTDAQGRQMIHEFGGKAGELVDEPSEALKWVTEHVQAEGMRLRPNPLLVGPDQDTVKQATATGLIAAMDAGALEMREPIGYETAAWEKVFRMIEHSLSFKEHKEEKIYVQAYGEERAPRREIERGYETEMGSEDFDFPHSIRVTALDERPSAQALRRQEAQVLWDRGEMLWEDYAAALGKTNATGFGRDLLAQKLSQMSRPQVINAAMTHRVMFIAARTGIPPERLMLLLSPAVPAAPEPSGGGASSANGNSPVQREQGQYVETAAMQQ